MHVHENSCVQHATCTCTCCLMSSDSFWSSPVSIQAPNRPCVCISVHEEIISEEEAG